MSFNYQKLVGFLGVCLSILALCESRQDLIVERIFNGKEVFRGRYPWVVSVRLDNVHVCMGTIITARNVITAGHCVSEGDFNAFDPKRVTMRVGSNNQYAGGYIVKARKIVIHGDYANFLHDLAIIELDSSLEFDNKVNKINLQEENAAVPEGVQLSVPGWGINENGQVPYKLQEVSMEVMSAKECEKAAGYGYKSVLCLKHKVGSGVCRGDDGAPVIHSGRLIGVVSFAFGNCGSEYPDVATSVSYYNHWINAAIF